MRIKLSFLFISLLVLIPAVSNAQEDSAGQQKADELIVYSGYFSREENDGKMARLSGKSHYMKFYAPDRIIRLFIPYPFSTTVKPETISKVFDKASKMTVGDAFIRSAFGYLEQDAIANIGQVKLKGENILFDCDASAPCRVLFSENELKVIKKGILLDHVIVYDYVDIEE